MRPCHQALPDDASSTSSLRTVILGAGAVTRLFYVPALRCGLEGLLLTALVDRSPQALDQLGPLPSGVRRLACDAADALADPALLANTDLALIALPHALHEPTVLAALDAGLHVFSEKPLGLSEGEVCRMLAAASAAQRLLGVCQPRRSFPVVAAIAELLASGRLGRLHSVSWQEGQPYAWPAQSLAQVSLATGGSELHDIGAHAFDLLCHWLGPLDVTGYADDGAGGTPAEFRITLANSLIERVDVRLSRLRHLANEVVITAERGTIVWSLSSPDRFRLDQSQLLGFPSVELRVAASGQPLSVYEGVQAQLVAFASAVAGRSALQPSAQGAVAYARIFDQCAERMAPIRMTGALLHAPAQPQAPAVQALAISEPEAPEVIVIGAAGFIGCALVEELLRQGRRVKALVHRPASAVRLLRHDVSIALCDVSRPETYRQHITPGAIVVNCAVSHAGDDLERVIIHGALALLDVAAAQMARRVVLLSSMMAYGDPPASGMVDEATRAAPSGMAYAHAKADMERRCRHRARSHAPELVILQPTCVFGPYGKDFGTAALDDMRTGGFFLHEGGKALANLVYVDNLVDAILLAMTKPLVSGSRYIVNEDTEATCWADFYGCLSEAAFGVAVSAYPLLGLSELQELCATWRRRHRFPDVLREAVRSSPAAVDWLVEQRWFAAWRNIRSRTSPKEIDMAGGQLSPLPEPSFQQATHPLEAATQRVREQLLAQRRLFINESIGRFFTSAAIFSSQRIRSELGWSPRVPRHEALSRTAEWATYAYAYRQRQTA